MFFSNHLNLAHSYWKACLTSGETAIDATCGNGHDSLILAKTALTEHSGSLYLCDLQQTAVDKSKALLQANLSQKEFERVQFNLGCHSVFPSELAPGSVKLIVYNLGYLPGGDKEITTSCSSTLLSLEKALQLVVPQGMISIMCYPGHLEGAKEEALILERVSQLSTFAWSCCHHRWVNGKKAPSLLLLQKK